MPIEDQSASHSTILIINGVLLRLKLSKPENHICFNTHWLLFVLCSETSRTQSLLHECYNTAKPWWYPFRMHNLLRVTQKFGKFECKGISWCNCCLHQSDRFESVYCDPSVFFHDFMSVLKTFCSSAWKFSFVLERRPFNWNFILE